MNGKKGFTIIEVIIVIVVIGLITVLSTLNTKSIRSRTQDASSSAKITIIAEFLEKYYNKNGRYPTCSEMTQSIAVVSTNLLTGIDGNILTAPSDSGGNNSIRCSDPSSTSHFGYIDGITKFTLKYFKSENSSIISVSSRNSPLPPPKSFAKSWGGTYDDYNADIAKTNDGGYITTGSTYSSSNPYSDIIITKYNSSGNILWNKTWGGASFDEGMGVIQDNDGNFIVIGETQSFGAGAADIVLIKYNNNGDVIWNKTWGSTSYDYGRKIIQNENGGYTAVGTTSGFGAGSTDMAIIEYDKNGNLLWNRTYGGTKIDQANSITQASDGSYAVAGYTTSYNDGSNYYDAILVKVNSVGTRLWSRTIGGTAYDEGRSVIVASDNYYIVNVYTSSNDGGSILTAKYDSSGNLIWDKVWRGPSSETGQSTVESNDNKYIVAGVTSSYGNGNSDIVLIKYDTDGNIIWNKTWGGASNEMLTKIIQLDDGGYVITGNTTSYSNGAKDILTIKFNDDGSINNCTSPMCQSPVASIGTLSTITTRRVSSPTIGTSTPSATEKYPTANTTTLNSNQLTITIQ